MSNTNKEWLDLAQYPVKPGYKWRAQDDDGRVFDYSVKPVELSEAGYLHWDDVPDAEFAAEYVGKFEVLGNWKDMCFNLKDVAEKQIKTPLPVTNPQCINHFSPRSVNTNDILTVISFAAERHKNQRRKDKDATPYINHPLAVAKMLSDHVVPPTLTTIMPMERLKKALSWFGNSHHVISPCLMNFES